MEEINEIQSSMIMKALVNSFTDIHLLQDWAFRYNLTNDNIVQHRLHELTFQQHASSQFGRNLQNNAHHSTSAQSFQVTASSSSSDEQTSDSSSYPAPIKFFRFCCDYCPASYTRMYNLRKHIRTNHQSSQELQCSKCSKTFLNKDLLYFHLTECKSCTCHLCNQVFINPQRLEEHLHLHSTDTAQNYLCNDCGSIHLDLHSLYVHRDAMHGGGDANMLQHAPWNIPPWELEDGTTDIFLADVYNANKRHILRQHRHTKFSSVYNFPTNNLERGYEQLQENLEYVYSQQQKAFKVNFAFGLILKRVSNDEDNDDNVDHDIDDNVNVTQSSSKNTYRYFIPYKNSNLFPYPMLISRKDDLDKVLSRLKHLDLSEYIKSQRPNSKWKPFLITNTNIIVYRTSFALGKGFLPDFIKNNRHIVSLECNAKGRVYKDSLCIFRCLCVHKSNSTNVLHRDVKQLYEQWRSFAGNALPSSLEHFPGIEIKDIPKFELEYIHYKVMVQLLLFMIQNQIIQM